MAAVTNMPVNTIACDDFDDFEPDDYFLLTDDGVMQTRTVRVTPDLAEAWLKRNVVNRRLSLPHCERLAWDMKSGAWKLTHQGIAFNCQGDLTDGQHRLYANTLAGVPLLMRVTFNCESDFSSPMDIGKVRTAADILKVSVRDAAIANALCLLETRETRRGTVTKIGLELEHHEAGIAWARTALPLRRDITANVVAGFVFAWPGDRPRVEAFAESFLNHTGASPTDPVVVLRRHVSRHRPVSSARLPLTLATLRCLQAYCEREEITRLYVNEQGFEYFKARRSGQ
jgi:hypothetical protein